MDKISQILTNWYTKNKRDLPWRHSKSSYNIWLSEIIMQQTQVVQGTPYYLKFIETFPNIRDLANASEDQVMSLWQGLGYYSRARNLHFTAKYISNELNGEFPSDPKEIIKLKGIGQYTCAAISTFAFDNPMPLVDGNVYRLFSRLFEIPTEINTPKGQKEFYALAENFLSIQSTDQAIIFNQAIMEFGALVCKPKTPKCEECPLCYNCQSFKNNTQLSFPYKKTAKKKEERQMEYLLLYSEDGIWTDLRTEKDIWQGLHQLILIKDRKELFPIEPNLINSEISRNVFSVRHSLSHQNISIQFHSLKIEDTMKIEYSIFRSFNELNSLGFPKPIVTFLKSYFPGKY